MGVSTWPARSLLQVRRTTYHILELAVQRLDVGVDQLQDTQLILSPVPNRPAATLEVNTTCWASGAAVPPPTSWLSTPTMKNKDA